MESSQVKMISFTKLKKKNSGYVLLFLMLIIASVALYLSYNLSLKKTNTQSALVAKTATEFSYWFDVEKNYETDFAITTPTALNAITMNTLISTEHYLPYGMTRAPGIPSTATPAVTAISEYQCSSLPGITQADNISDSGITDYTCPTQNGVAQSPQCTFNEKAYLSCAPSATAPSTGSSAPTNAQYYINGNHIALGTNSNTYDNNMPIGLGLIIRTPGTASGSVTLSGGGSRGLLPNGSFAQSLISLLPSSSYNIYTTANSNVKGIGIGSYLSNPGSSGVLQDNNRYTKIVDMGLVQSVDLNTVQALKNGGNPPCYGWDSSGNKIGTNGSYTLNRTTAPTGGVANSFPPTCIRIDMSKYGPGGSANCQSLDLLFSIYRNYLQNDATTTNGTDMSSSRFFSATDAMITSSAAGSNFRDVYLAQSIQDFANISSYTYSANGPVPTSTTQPEQYNWLIYVLRCTRANT